MIELARPESVGLCADRLARIAAHFNRYVDDGLIPGYLVMRRAPGASQRIGTRYGLPVMLKRAGRSRKTRSFASIP